MPAFQSVVEAISIKPLSEPDRYGNTFRASVKFGEDWYSWGSLKKEEINFKNGSGWHRLAKGDEIEGMYKENGDWKNIQPKTVTLVSEGKGTPPPQAKPAAKSSGDSFVNPAEIGQCMNLAVQRRGYEQSRQGCTSYPVVQAHSSAIQLSVSHCGLRADSDGET
jgi:hypothetical protein